MSGSALQISVPSLVSAPPLTVDEDLALFGLLILALSLPLAPSLTRTLALHVPPLLAPLLTVDAPVSGPGFGSLDIVSVFPSGAGLDSDADSGFLDDSTASCPSSSSDCAFALGSGSDFGPGSDSFFGSGSEPGSGLFFGSGFAYGFGPDSPCAGSDFDPSSGSVCVSGSVSLDSSPCPGFSDLFGASCVRLRAHLFGL